MNPLDPRVTIAWRLTGLIFALPATAIVGLIEGVVLAPAGIRLIAPGVIAGLAALLLTGFSVGWPALRYRFWRWQVEADRVLIVKGVLWRSRSLIPRVRIQHVDTRSSPLQRWLGLNSLVIYTAGTRGADAEIPGLAADEAERLREELARLEELDDRP
ncbi:MAG: PH domain-containing protein [Gemmatimonadetes bacterium]|nr:PH domain-containing protein [Gemmatimonadota bacterium]NIO30430.1 PH domain-containing protein [Gemmatimonadota bacterium]